MTLKALSEVMWMLGRLLEVMGAAVSGVLVYFVLIKDPDFPVTPQQMPTMVGLLGLFLVFTVLGAVISRWAGRITAEVLYEAEMPASGPSTAPAESSATRQPWWTFPAVLLGAVLVWRLWSTRGR